MQIPPLNEIVNQLNDVIDNSSVEFKQIITNIMNSGYNFELKQNLLLQLNSIVLTSIMALKGIHQVMKEVENGQQH